MAKTKWRHLTRRQKIRRAASTSAPATPEPAPVTLTPQQQEPGRSPWTNRKSDPEPG